MRQGRRSGGRAAAGLPVVVLALSATASVAEPTDTFLELLKAKNLRTVSSCINQAYHYLVGNTALLPAAVWAMFVAGFAEETVFRGYLFERLGKLFGPSVGARIAIVLITSAWFGLSHYSNQGLAGAEQGVIVGLVFGTVFATTGRLWMLMCAHTAFDLTALAIIYWDLEAEVARFILR